MLASYALEGIHKLITLTTMVTVCMGNDANRKKSTKNVKLTSLLACPFFISFCDVMVSQRELNSLVLSGLAHLLHNQKSGVQFHVKAFFFYTYFEKRPIFHALSSLLVKRRKEGTL